MCGFSGFISTEKCFELELRNSLKAIDHRGPDNSSFVLTQQSNVFFGFGHNRLSILDLSASANQPMKSACGVILAFNGEIYNFRLLRELYLSDVIFSTSSDTEVLLQMYLKFGKECFSLINGMFAFSLFDPRNKTTYLVRDSIGIKPIYYSVSSKEGVVFSSEIKGVKAFPFVNKQIDQQDLFEFINNGFVYEPNTGFLSIKKVPPSHYVEINNDTLQLTYHEYSVAFNDKTEDLETAVKSSIKEQLCSDVPIGLFFSGGMDSSILASYVDDISLIFAEYASQPDSDVDRIFSSKISSFLDKNLSIIKLKDDINPESLIEQVKFVAINSEEMISDYTFWSTYNISKAARTSGYKVMLSGMGGDELFAGYPRYFLLRYYKILKFLSPIINLFYKLKLYPNGFNKKVERLVSFCNEKNFLIGYTRLIGYFSSDELRRLYKVDVNFDDYQERYLSRLSKLLLSYQGDSADLVKLAQHIDRYGFLSHNLSVSDKASMLASIELRVPLLSERLSYISSGIDSKLLCNLREGKLPLRKILEKCLPRSMTKRPKTGFNPPLDALIENVGEELITRELMSGELSVYFNDVFIANIVVEHFSRVKNNSYKLWQLLYLKFWLQENKFC